MLTRALIIFNLILCCFNINVQAESKKFNVNPELFPVPDNLVHNVNFWIDIFTKYNSKQVVLHDTEDLRIIYEVVDFSQFYGDSVEISRKHWRKIDLIREQYKRILVKLAAIKPASIRKLSSEELRVYNLFKQAQKSSRFRRAARNMRAQKGLNDIFLEGLIRSGLYINEMHQIFKKHSLPDDLIYLPHVESSFNIRTYSRVGAAGIWQFTRRTGRRFMKINYVIDERYDPYHSTEAAAQLLKENYQELGNWPLAITAYNHGLNGMRRAKKMCNTSDLGVIIQKYRSRTFRFASKNFYSEFIAAVHVRKNYKTYFGNIKLIAPQKYSYFEVPHYMNIKKLSIKLGLDIEQIKILNPSIRKPVLRSQRRIPRGFRLRIPWRSDANIKALYAEIPNKEKHQSQLSSEWYQVRPGDNLELIAKKAQLPIDSLLAYNDLQDPNQIYAGEVLRISKEHEIKSAVTPLVQKKDNATKRPSDFANNHDVARKNLHQAKISSNKKSQTKSDVYKAEEAIAQNLPAKNISQPKKYIKSESAHDSSADLTNMTIEPTRPNWVTHLSPVGDHSIDLNMIDAASDSDNVIVEPDETLGHFADWLEIPTRVLRKVNKLRYGQDIQIGEKIELSFANVSWQEFQRRRMEYHKSIEEDFFENFKIENVQIHQIKYGENIWDLCNQVYEIPYWLVFKYNAHIDLQKLRVGDEIIIPVLRMISLMNTNEDIVDKDKS